MNKALKYVGIDGCPAGWFYVAIDDRGGYSFKVLERFSAVDQLIPTAALILVDIPIGLPSRGDESRLCDTEARKMIKPRGSCVFPAPARSALDKQSYQDGSVENFRVLGRRLSRQSWAIAFKIKQVDDFMRAAKPGTPIREMHPEVAFCALNDGTPMRHSKKRTAGVNERLAVLAEHWAPAEACYLEAFSAYLRKTVPRDDILDAMAGAVMASKSPALATLPPRPKKDEEGLPMEIVYWLGNRSNPESAFRNCRVAAH